MDTQYVTLKGGGLEANLLAYYPDIPVDQLGDIVHAVWMDNSDVLYSPNQYYVGTVIAIQTGRIPGATQVNTPKTTTSTPLQG
jgi:hypothetical protein